MADQLIKFFIAFFVVVDPIALAPVFGAMTAGASDSYRRRMATKAVLISAVICMVFAIGGSAFLDVTGISLAAFRIGGGILLFLIAIDMVFARNSPVRATTTKEDDEARYREDISVFPLSFPLVTGPGSMATVILAFGEPHTPLLLYVGQLLAILVVLALALLSMLLATPAMRVLGVTGANVVGRLAGVILAALAVQYVIDGVKGAFGA
jgi:multiple antibiotic resistance protein